MATAEDIRSVVERYLAGVSAGDADAIAALYAEDAIVEDPAGSDAHVGRAAIHAFYASVSAPGIETKLVGGVNVVDEHTAAFHFAVVIDGNTVVEPIDIMTFDDEARITSMRAYWSM
jgi:steroid delta-isomerase